MWFQPSHECALCNLCNKFNCVVDNDFIFCMLSYMTHSLRQLTLHKIYLFFDSERTSLVHRPLHIGHLHLVQNLHRICTAIDNTQGLGTRLGSGRVTQYWYQTDCIVSGFHDSAIHLLPYQLVVCCDDMQKYVYHHNYSLIPRPQTLGML